MFKKIFYTLAGLFAVTAAAFATVPNPPTPTDPSQLVFLLNTLVQSINNNVTPATMGNVSNFRNYLDNGAMGVFQRGGTATCGTTSGIPSSAYGPDRWGCIVNVTSGAGQLTAVTSSPTPPPGFLQSATLVRNSGSLAQPQCTWQEIPTQDALQLAGQNVILSSYMQALAGLSADNGNLANLVIVTGTGTDQGLGTFTTSPAITPAWTNIATLQNQSFTLTTAWNRYSAPAVLVPNTVTEIGVGVCFTPTTTSTGGATDGLAFTGVQLEPVTGITSYTPSQFEFRPVGVELTKVERYYWQELETNGGSFGAGLCQATNTPKVPVQFPVTMRVAPTATLTVGGFSLAIAGAAATAGTGINLTNGTVNNASIAFTNTCTAGGTISMVGTNTTGKFQFSADF